MKSGWTILPFGEVFDDVSGGNRKIPQSAYLPEGNLPVIDQGKSLVAGYVNELDAACKAHPPVIVFGDHTRCFKYIDFPFAMGADGIKVLKPKVKSDAKYLFYYLRRLNIPDTGYDRHFKYLKRSQITLPPLPEQQRIAAILDKADAMRELRRQSITKLDTLLKAVFLEMFGDPVRNPKGWTTAQLGEVAEIASGAMKGRKFNGQATVLMPYLRVANVQDGFIDLREVKEIEVLATDIERYRLQPGDVLMTEGGDPDKLGRGAIWRGEIPNCLHQNHIFRVRPNHRSLLPEFLSGLIGSERGKRYFLREAKQTTGIATINMTQLRAFPVLLPPIELQQKYLKFVEMVQFLAIKITRSAEKHEELFRALQQRAFTGQLFTEKAAAAAQQELFAD